MPSTPIDGMTALVEDELYEERSVLSEVEKRHKGRKAQLVCIKLAAQPAQSALVRPIYGGVTRWEAVLSQ